MNLYLISQTANSWYDTYDSAVVCAPDEDTARNMDPMTGHPFNFEERSQCGFRGVWCDRPEEVKVQLIGKAVEGIEQGVVCASFNAG